MGRTLKRTVILLCASYDEPKFPSVGFPLLVANAVMFLAPSCSFADEWSAQWEPVSGTTSAHQNSTDYGTHGDGVSIDRDYSVNWLSPSTIAMGLWRGWDYSNLGDASATPSIAPSGVSNKSVGGTGQAKLTGTGRVRLLWSPSYEGEEPPENVNLVWTAGTQGVARPVAQGQPSQAYSSTATRGTVTVAVSASVEGGNTLETHFYGQSDDLTRASYSRALGRYKVQKGIVGVGSVERSYVLGPLVTLSAEANISAARSYPVQGYNNTTNQQAFAGETSVSSTADGALDPREMWLLRSGAPSPKVKGTKDATGNPIVIDEDHDEWRELNDAGQWTTHGQSRWSYTYRVAATGGFEDSPVTIPQIIGAQLSFGWGAYNDLHGSWSPLNADHDVYPPGTTIQNAGHSHVENLPDGGSLLDDAGSDYNQYGPIPPFIDRPKGWYKVPSTGASPTVSYELTDADSAKAKAFYVFQLHDEWEHKTPDSAHNWSNNQGPQSGQERWTTVLFDTPETPVTNDSATANSTPFNWSLVTTTTMKGEASVGANFNYHDAINLGASASIGKAVEITKPSGTQITLGPNEQAYPCLQLIWTRKFYLLDHYVVSGFDANPAHPTDGKWSQWFDDAPDVIAARWWRNPTSGDPRQSSTRPSSTPHQFGPADNFNPAPPPGGGA